MTLGLSNALPVKQNNVGLENTFPCLPSLFSKLSFDPLNLIFNKLEIRDWNTLRRVSQSFCKFIDRKYLKIEKIRDLFCLGKVTVLPQTFPGVSCITLHRNRDNRLTLNSGGKLIECNRTEGVETTLCEDIPSSNSLIGFKDNYKWYSMGSRLIVVHDNGHKKEFDTALYCDKAEIKEESLKAPLRAYLKSEIITCVTRAGILVSWNMTNGEFVEFKQLKFRKIVEAVATDDLLIVSGTKKVDAVDSLAINSTEPLIIKEPNEEGVYVLDQKNEFEFRSKILNETPSLMHIFNDKLVCLTSQGSGRCYLHIFKIDAQRVEKTHTIHLASWINLLTPKLEFMYGLVLGQFENFLVLSHNGSDSKEFTVINSERGEVVKEYAFKAYPTIEQRQFKRNMNAFDAWVVEGALVVLNPYECELTIFSIPTLRCISKKKLNEISTDFNHQEEDYLTEYFKVYGARTADYILARKVEHNVNFQYSSILHQDGEFLLPYKFSSENGTSIFKILSIDIKVKATLPKMESAHAEPRTLIVEEVSAKPAVPLQAAQEMHPKIRPISSRNFPTRKFVIIGSGVGLALISTIVFACLNYTCSSTSLYHSLLGRGLMIASGSSFLVFGIGGAVYIVKHKKKKS